MESTWDRTQVDDTPKAKRAANRRQLPETPVAESDEASCGCGELARIVSSYDWVERRHGDHDHDPSPPLTLERLGSIVVPALQMLIQRIEQLERAAPRMAANEWTNLSLADLERAAIIHALQQSHGVQNQAAKRLGISPRVMHYRVKQLNLYSYCTGSRIDSQDDDETSEEHIA